MSSHQAPTRLMHSIAWMSARERSLLWHCGAESKCWCHASLLLSAWFCRGAVHIL